MQTAVRSLLVLGAALCWVGQAPAQAKSANLAATEDVASSIRLLEAWVESQMAYRGLPGLSIAIVHDQDIVWSRGFGHADRERKIAATPATIYRIASISKLFTSTAVMQLRDQGKLKLDDPVSKHLPWFKLKNAKAEDAPITIRHLLTHTAGLPRESPFPYWSDFQFPTRAQMIEAFAKQETVYPPETEWKYSNLGLAIAGEIVATVSGESFEGYIQKHILGPLQMRSTSVVLPEADRPRLAIGYGRRLPDGSRALRPFTDAKAITPAANLSSTVEDLARFVALQMRDGPAGNTQILKGSTLREMQRVHWLMPDWKSGRGLGFHIIHRETGDLVGHGGWVAGYQTAVYFRPRDKIAVIALTNADDGRPYPGLPGSVVDRAFQWVAPAIARAASPPKETKPRPEWQKYAGKYRNPWGDSEVLVYGGELVLINPTDEDPSGEMAVLVPVKEHIFRIKGGSPSGPHGELVVFEMKNGKVVRVKIGENFAEPQEPLR
jgi:CubicO group peptidase (beta-lactamase class C family)